MPALTVSVGQGGANRKPDVTHVQQLLNTWLKAQGDALIGVDGNCDGDTIDAIKAFQLLAVGLAAPDGLISPGGKTWLTLSAPAAVPSLSGAAWWHANQARYPNSARVEDLIPAFRAQVTRFIDALKAAGATVAVSSTRRNATRAQLMHYCWRIANEGLDPKKVPALPGVTIKWDHGDLARSKQGAREMVELFAIAYAPSLTSRHIEGRAIDMTIGWNGALKIKDAQGKLHELGAPRTGNDNTQLHAIGAGYGVRKLATDPPHWSDDGR